MNQLQAARLGFAPPKAKAPAKSTGVAQGASSHSASSGTGNIVQHLSQALALHKSGNHGKAKKHALAAVNMLHNMPQDGPAPAPGAGVASAS